MTITPRGRQQEPGQPFFFSFLVFVDVVVGTQHTTQKRGNPSSFFFL